MTNIGQKYVEKTKQLGKATKTIKSMERDYKALEEKLNAVMITNEEWESKFKLLQQGGVMVCVDNEGYVTEAIKFPAYHETTFDQEIPEEIGTPLYNSIKFIKIVDGKMIKDTDKYKKYLSVR